MSKLTVAEKLVDVATKAVQFKNRLKAQSRYQRKAICAEIHIKQVEETENSVESMVAPLFEEQIQTAAGRLKSLEGDDKTLQPIWEKTFIDAAEALASQVFDPREWNNRLIDRALPPLALSMVEAARAQMNLMEEEKGHIFPTKQDDIFDELIDYEHTGTSTASEWLAQEGPELGDVDFVVGNQTVSMRIATELPSSMKVSIKERLKETFAQDYWEKINQTTYGDIRSFLAKGLRDGHSIQRMAANIVPELLEKGIYARRRARNIARTESGNALNGARVASIDALQEEVGGQVDMRKVWLSVLGNTTRDTHADLDNVPADKEGRWELSGYKVRWPADVVLPPSERCNCQCTVLVEFGMTDSEADELLQDYYDRIAAYRGLQKHLPGQHSQASHGHGKGGGLKDENGNYIPGKVGKESGVDTSYLDKSNPKHQWAMGKIAQLEELAAEGNWDKFHKKLSKPKTPYKKLNKWQKTIIKAQENLLEQKAQKLQKPPQGVNASSSKPEQISSGGWKKVGPQLGTEKGGLYEKDGKKFYVKTPDNPDRARNEVLALKLYEAAGATAVKGHLTEIDGKPAVATEWMDNSKKVNWDSPEAKVVAASDFATHAWLNNRDAVGAGTENPMDNMRWSADGKLTMLDAGGSMEYKGMGGGGKKDFKATPTEWDTLRNKSINPTMGQVFGDMTPQQLAASAKKLQGISDDTIDQLVSKYGPGDKASKDQLALRLKIRRDTIVNKGKKLEESFAAKTAAKAATAATVGKKMTIPPPPKITAKTELYMQKKYDKLHAAAQKGDLAAVKAFKANPNSKNAYTKKLVAYKNQVIASMESGGKVAPAHQAAAKKATPKTPKPPKKITIKQEKFPPAPEFVSKIQQNVLQNKAKVVEALGHAQKGDLSALQQMQLTPSPKLKSWHAELVSNVSNQLNPPPPPKRIRDDYKKITDSISGKPVSKLKDVGYWSVLGDVGGVPNGKPKGKGWLKSHGDEAEKLHSDGYQAYIKSGAKQALKEHTGGGYITMNSAMRAGELSSNAAKKGMRAAKAIIDKGIELPAGLQLSRKHNKIPIESLKVGHVVSDKGNLSTSINPNVWGGPVHWQLTVGHGVKGMPAKSFSVHKSEEEVILASNQRILITKIEKGVKKKFGGTSDVVHGVVLPTQSNQCCPP